MSYENFLEYIDKLDQLDKNTYNSLVNIFKDNTNIYFDKYINNLNQDEYIKNIAKFEYYLNANTFHTMVNHKYTDPNITAYYNDISKYPVLTSDEEKIILNKIYKLKNILNKRKIDKNYLNSILKKYGYNKEIKEDLLSRKVQLNYLKKLISDDLNLKKGIKMFELYVYNQNLREKFINSNLRLVLSFLKNKNIKACDMLDYIQWGNEGLIYALHNYDPKHNTKFSTYAYYWINCKINLGLFKERKKVKSSYDMYFLAYQYSAFCSLYFSKIGVYPTHEEKINFIYDKIYKKNNKGNIDSWRDKCEEKLLYIKNILETENAISLDIEIGETQDNTIADMVVDLQTDVEKEGTAFELKDMFKKVFANFTNAQVCIILLRNGVGINNYLSFSDFEDVFSNLPLEIKKKVWTSKRKFKLQEIGDLFNVSRQDIFIKEKNIKRRLKKYQYFFDEYLD